MANSVSAVAESSIKGFADTGGLAGHPRGLSTLFFTEMWERFSFYGMKAILVLYMVAAPAVGGLGLDTPHATAIYGTYLMAAYLLCLPGGMVADRLLGRRRAVFVGGLMIASGHFVMAVPAISTFIGGLALIACGTGLLKPNVSAMVGGLYGRNDARRDSGFSIFYMGINLGAFLAPLVCGYLAEADGFKSLMRALGVDPARSWQFGFAAAGVGMICGLLVFMLQGDRLPNDEVRRVVDRPVRSTRQSQRGNRQRAVYVGLAVVTVAGTVLAGPAWQAVLPFLLAFDGLVVVILMGLQEKLPASDWKRLGIMGICFLVSTAFWCAYEQKGCSLNLLTRDLVRRDVHGFIVPAAWFQSLTALYVILLVPVFAALWARLGHRQPSTPAKMALAPLIVGIGFAVFALLCGSLRAGDTISPAWIAGLFLFDVFGELCLSPIGLNLVTRLAPARMIGLNMGLWFFGGSFGYKLAGYLAGFYVPVPARLAWIYGGIAAGLVAVGFLLLALVPAIRALMEDASDEGAVAGR